MHFLLILVVTLATVLASAVSEIETALQMVIHGPSELQAFSTLMKVSPITTWHKHFIPFALLDLILSRPWCGQEQVEYICQKFAVDDMICLQLLKRNPTTVSLIHLLSNDHISEDVKLDVSRKAEMHVHYGLVGITHRHYILDQEKFIKLLTTSIRFEQHQFTAAILNHVRSKGFCPMLAIIQATHSNPYYMQFLGSILYHLKDRYEVSDYSQFLDHLAMAVRDKKDRTILNFCSSLDKDPSLRPELNAALRQLSPLYPILLELFPLSASYNCTDPVGEALLLLRGSPKSEAASRKALFYLEDLEYDFGGNLLDLPHLVHPHYLVEFLSRAKVNAREASKLFENGQCSMYVFAFLLKIALKGMWLEAGPLLNVNSFVKRIPDHYCDYMLILEIMQAPDRAIKALMDSRRSDLRNKYQLVTPELDAIILPRLMDSFSDIRWIAIFQTIHIRISQVFALKQKHDDIVRSDLEWGILNRQDSVTRLKYSQLLHWLSHRNMFNKVFVGALASYTPESFAAFGLQVKENMVGQILLEKLVCFKLGCFDPASHVSGLCGFSEFEQMLIENLLALLPEQLKEMLPKK